MTPATIALCSFVVAIADVSLEPDYRISPAELVRRAVLGENWSSKNDRRLADLRARLSQVAIVGYVTGTGRYPGDADTRDAYFKTQYALAPIRIEGLTGQAPSPFEYVIGDFSVPAELQAIVATMRLTVIAAYGDGLVLLRRVS